MNQFKFLINTIPTASLTLTGVPKEQLGKNIFLMTSHGKERSEVLC